VKYCASASASPEVCKDQGVDSIAIVAVGLSSVILTYDGVATESHPIPPDPGRLPLADEGDATVIQIADWCRERWPRAEQGDDVAA
jgi:hypothetical protein